MTSSRTHTRRSGARLSISATISANGPSAIRTRSPGCRSFCYSSFPDESHFGNSAGISELSWFSDSGFPDSAWCDSLLLREILGAAICRPHPIQLRTRVVAYADEGHGHREAARHLRVSPKFVNDLVKLRCERGSREGAIGLAVLLWSRRRGQGKGNLALLVVPVTLIAFAALYMTSGVIDRMDGSGEDARFAILHEVVEGISDRPWLGHGAGAFQEAFRPYLPAEHAAFGWDKAHNTYLENAFEFGLPAAALFFTAFGTVGRRLLQGVLTRRRNQRTPAFALACFAAVTFHSAFDFNLQLPAIASLFAAITSVNLV